MAAKCSRKRIVIKKGRKVIAEFMGRQGSGCPPRKKPSTAHLRAYKAHMKVVAPSCRRRFKPFTKPYGKCVKDAFRNYGG